MRGGGQASNFMTPERGVSEPLPRRAVWRANLYRVLAPGANPSYMALRRVMDALGVSLTAVSKGKDAAHA